MSRVRDIGNNFDGSKIKIIDAKGDLIAGTSADNTARLATGSNGQYLQADSTQVTGLKWSDVTTDPMPQIMLMMGA